MDKNEIPHLCLSLYLFSYLTMLLMRDAKSNRLEQMRLDVWTQRSFCRAAEPTSHPGKHTPQPCKTFANV